MPIVHVKITGMTCGSCTYKIECEVGDLEGVTEAKADLEKGTGVFTIEQGAPTTAEDIVNLIIQLGEGKFKAELEKIE